MVLAALALAPVQPVADIPCELVGHHLFVQVSVNRSGPLAFIFDTGAGATIISAERARALGLKPGGSVPGGGAGGEPVVATVYPGTKLVVGGLRAPERTVYGLPLEHAERLIGRRLDGVLGYDFFSKYVVEFDYTGRRVRLYEPESYRYAGPGETMPFRLVMNHPRVKATVTGANGTTAEGEFTVDTGAGNDLALATHFVADHGLLTAEQERMPTIPLGEGAGGQTTGVRSRIRELRLGRLVITRPVTDFSRDTSGYLASKDLAGIIGYGILSRYKLIVDYSRLQMALEPAPLRADWHEPGLSGLAFEAEPPDFHPIRVRMALKHSPAERAGVQVGDVLVEANGRPASQCTLTALHEALDRPGKQVNLVLKRGEMTVRATVVVEEVK